MISALIVFLAVDEKKESDEKKPKRDSNKTEMRQCCCYRNNGKENQHSIVIVNPSGPSSSCCRLHCHPQSLRHVVFTPPTLPLLLLKYLFSYSSSDASVVVVNPLGQSLSPAASAIGSNPSDASSIPHPLPTPKLLLLSPWAPLPPPTPLSLLINWTNKHTADSIIWDVLSGASSLLIPLTTPTLLLSIPRDHLSMPTPPPLSQIP